MINNGLDRRTILEERQQHIRGLIKKKGKLTRQSLLIGIFMIVIPFLVNKFIVAQLHFSSSIVNEVNFVCFLYGILFLTIAIIRPKNEHTTELQEIENELDMLNIGNSSIEERAEKLFKHHHFELKRYYDENLKQSSWLFFVGIVCILFGFVIIGVTLYLLILNISNQLENKIIIASIGAIGAVLSNFIAVIYLKMHSETVKSLTQFHNRFVNTHHFHFGNFLVSKIQDQEKRENALSELALSITKNVTNEDETK